MQAAHTFLYFWAAEVDFVVETCSGAFLGVLKIGVALKIPPTPQVEGTNDSFKRCAAYTFFVNTG